MEVEAILHFFKGRWADVCLMLSNDGNIYMQAGAGMPFAGTDLPIEPAQMAAFQNRVTFRRPQCLSSFRVNIQGWYLGSGSACGIDNGRV